MDIRLPRLAMRPPSSHAARRRLVKPFPRVPHHVGGDGHSFTGMRHHRVNACQRDAPMHGHRVSVALRCSNPATTSVRIVFKHITSEDQSVPEQLHHPCQATDPQPFGNSPPLSSKSSVQESTLPSIPSPHLMHPALPTHQTPTVIPECSLVHGFTPCFILHFAYGARSHSATSSSSLRIRV